MSTLKNITNVLRDLISLRLILILLSLAIFGLIIGATPVYAMSSYGLGTDGLTSYLYNPSIIPNTSGDASFDFWFYWKNAGNYASRKGIFTTGSPTNDSPSYLLYVDPDGHLGMYDNAGHGCIENAARIWTQNTWYHIYWGWDSVSGTCYFGFNGNVTTASSAPGNYNGQAMGLWWGTGYYGKVNGIFDEIRVSDVVRWTNNFSLPTSEYLSDAHTTALWHLDEGSGPISADSSGNGYTLALSGATWEPGYFGPLPTPTPTAIPTPSPTPVPVPPQIQPLIGATLLEGDSYTTQGSFNDPDSSSWTGSVDYGDGSGIQTLALSGTSFALSHQYKDEGQYTVTVSITDNQGFTGTASTSIMVNNAPFTVSSITAPTTPILINTSISASASFSDPGVLDTHTGIWNWGDGVTSVGTVTEIDGSGSISGTHTYTSSGVYTITLAVTDDDGLTIDAPPFQ